MRSQRKFLPVGNEPLEVRTGPSGSSGLSGLMGSVPAQDARQVVQAFQTFEQTYTKDVQTILLPKGTTNPATNRPVFDTAVGTALTTLNASIDTAIANLPTAATLDTQIQGELLGTGTSSLQARLVAIPSPTARSFRGSISFTVLSQSDIGHAGSTIAHQIATAPAPAGGITAATVQTDLKAIQAAFQTFNHTYNTNIKTVLLATGGVNVIAPRTAFDITVGTALNTLNTSISTALSNLPSSVASSLSTSIQNDLLTGTQTSKLDLQSRLAALKTPTSGTGVSLWLFKLGSTLNITFAEGKVAADLASAVSAYNSTL